MSAPYDEALQQLAEEKALEAGIKLHRGVYVSVTGPNLETRQNTGCFVHGVRM